MSQATRTYTPKAGDITPSWRVIDATDRPLGRLASEVAQILKGKDKPYYTPNLDTGDFVIVINASKVHVSSDKRQTKFYYTHSMYPSGLKKEPLEKLLARQPRRVIEWAVWGMLPKGPLGRDLLRKLKVYAEDSHPHGAQVKDFAAPSKVGKPGKPRPARKAAATKAESTQAEATETAPAKTSKPTAARIKAPKAEAAKAEVTQAETNPATAPAAQPEPETPKES